MPADDRQLLRQSFRRLVGLQPRTARVIRDGTPTDVPAAEVAAGDLVLVRPGARVPADGEVAEGEIMTMPGLPKVPSAEVIRLNEERSLRFAPVARTPGGGAGLGLAASF